MKVHRCAFVPLTPKAITAISASAGKIAVARENGEVEIHDTAKNFYISRKIYLQASSMDVQSVGWISLSPSCSLSPSSDNHLITAGLDGYLRLWDVQKCTLVDKTESLGGPVWSISVHGSQVACGCDDGTVRIFDLSSGRFAFVRATTRQNGRILGVCWNDSGSLLATCSSSGKVGLWDTVNGRQLSLAAPEPQKTAGSTVIWAICWLNTDSFATGDASGTVCIWNASTMTLSFSINTHNADILTLAYDAKEQFLFAAGVDSKIVKLTPVPAGGGVSAGGLPIIRKDWIISSQCCNQFHDVKALAIAEDCRGKRILLSGGIDTNLYVFPTDSVIAPSVRRIPSVGMDARAISFSAARSLIAANMHSSVNIWKMAESGYKFLAEVNVPQRWGIVESLISPCGSFLAASSMEGTCVFSLHFQSNGMLSKVVRLAASESTSDSCLPPARQLKFVANVLYLLNLKENSIFSYALPQKEQEKSIVPFKALRDPTDAPIESFAISNCNTKIALVALEESTGKSKITILPLANPHDYSVLPRLDTPCHFVEWNADGTLLLAATTSNYFAVFDCNSGTMHPWSLAHSSLQAFPRAWTARKELILGAFFLSRSQVMLWGMGFVARVDLTRFTSAPAGKKRKATGVKCTLEKEQQESAISICLEYSHIVGVAEAVQAEEDCAIVVVERPWREVASKLPAPFFRERFGAK